MAKKKSAASKRAESYPNRDNEWYCGFAYTGVTGIGFEEGIHRRDPTSVIKVGELFYVYYTKSSGVYLGRSHAGDPSLKRFPWDQADIWYATSVDGVNWVEKGCAVSRGTKGSFDDRTVCTPDVLAHNEKYYLVYQTQAYGISYTGITENVGMAVADSPEGPFVKVDKPIIEPMKGGRWFEDEDSYNTGYFWGVTHDPMLMFYQDKFWLYYKGGVRRPEAATPEMRLYYAGPDTRWGVAHSDTPEGPYLHSEYNPVTNSGHETLLWHYNGGIAALLNRDGPEKDTIQFASDGINFEIMAHVGATPQAGGAYRPDDSNEFALQGLQWGLCHLDERGSLWNHIVRFDIDTRPSYVHSLSYPPANNSSIN